MKQTEQNKTSASLRLEIVEKIQSLVTAGLGLVAALAWNDAIQGLFVVIFGVQSSVIAKFFYAIVVTTLVVYLTVRISRLINRLKKINPVRNSSGVLRSPRELPRTGTHAPRGGAGIISKRDK